MSDQPKEPRYRRKPLEWKLDSPGPCNVWKATALGQTFNIYERGDDCIASVGLMEWCEYGANLDEAKARVEAEITRRLESVLEVVND